jgi:lysophospholipase L1-like esterase
VVFGAVAVRGAARNGDAATASYPSGIAAAGDSLSTGYGSVDRPGQPARDHPENSWAIGGNPAVASHYGRIRRKWPQITGRTLLAAQDGAHVAALGGQLERVASHGEIDYVTIQIGVNDICDARRPSEITPPRVFRTRFARALDVLRRGAPNARLLVTSLADEARWNDAVLQIPGMASQIEDGTVCDPMGRSDGRQNPAVRALIHRYEEAYNRVLASICAHFLHCRYDGGALYRLAYRPEDVSKHDAFHPSVKGLAKMAAVTWRASFDFTNGDPPPRPSATVSRSSAYSTVTLRVSGDSSVRGIECRRNGGPYAPYRRALRLPHGSRLTCRAVGVEGNFSASRVVVV